MTKPRTTFSYSALRKRIVAKLKETTETLRKIGYESQRISPREFYNYMTGETPTGDTITIVDVLNNEFLMIHEIVEISELKKMGIPISKRTFMMLQPQMMYETHYTATEYEFDYALHKGTFDWLKIRINHAKSWLEGDHMPQHLVPQYKALVEKFSQILSKREQKTRTKDELNTIL